MKVNRSGDFVHQSSRFDVVQNADSSENGENNGGVLIVQHVRIPADGSKAVEIGAQRCCIPRESRSSFDEFDTCGVDVTFLLDGIDESGASEVAAVSFGSNAAGESERTQILAEMD